MDQVAVAVQELETHQLRTPVELVGLMARMEVLDKIAEELQELALA